MVEHSDCSNVYFYLPGNLTANLFQRSLSIASILKWLIESKVTKNDN